MKQVYFALAGLFFLAPLFSQAASTVQVDNAWTLTVARQGVGSGNVVSEYPWAGIDCGATCIKTYSQHANVTLLATPDAGSKLVGWTGCDFLLDNGVKCGIKSDTDRTVTVTFEQNKFGLLGIIKTTTARLARLKLLP